MEKQLEGDLDRGERKSERERGRERERERERTRGRNMCVRSKVVGEISVHEYGEQAMQNAI